MAIMSTLSNSPTTVATEIATTAGVENPEEADYQLPHFSPNEKSIILEWAGDDENNLAPPHAYTRLLKILWRHFGEKTQPPPGTPISFQTRLYSFGFAKHNGKIMNNPLAQMVTFLMIRRLHSTNLDLPPYHHESYQLHSQLQGCWFKFLEYLNLGD